MPDLLDALRSAVGDRHLLTDPDVRAPYERDWTGRFVGEAVAVVRPGNAAEVAAALAACAEHGVVVVPQGGNTGLVGASVPRGREEGLQGGAGGKADGRDQVVLSLVRLDDIGEVDAPTGQVSAGAGATLAALQAAARAAGFDAGVDFGARDSATLGGLAACDAGGARALRHGTVRARVAGLEAVLADGTVVDRMSGLTKDNAGYDLPALLVGSEGTLAVITRIRWRLVPLESARVAALVPLPDLDAAASLLATLRREVPSLEAADFFTDDGLSLVLAHLRAEPPVPVRAPVYAMLECAAPADPTAELAAGLEAAGIEDAVVADDTASRERLWRFREAHTEAIAAAGIPHKLDVGVPLDRLAELARRVPEVVGAGVRPILFGHLGDGNVHVNLLGPASGDGRADGSAADLALDDDAPDLAVLELVASLGGTISAEHGVGVAKAAHLPLVRPPRELAAMRAIKAALDPQGLLNPGAVLSRA